MTAGRDRGAGGVLGLGDALQRAGRVVGTASKYVMGNCRGCLHAPSSPCPHQRPRCRHPCFSHSSLLASNQGARAVGRPAPWAAGRAYVAAGRPQSGRHLSRAGLHGLFAHQPTALPTRSYVWVPNKRQSAGSARSCRAGPSCALQRTRRSSSCGRRSQRQQQPPRPRHVTVHQDYRATLHSTCCGTICCTPSSAAIRRVIGLPRRTSLPSAGGPACSSPCCRRTVYYVCASGQVRKLDGLLPQLLAGGATDVVRRGWGSGRPQPQRLGVEPAGTSAQLGEVGGGEGSVWVGADGSPALGGFAPTPAHRQRFLDLVQRPRPARHCAYTADTADSQG